LLYRCETLPFFKKHFALSWLLSNFKNLFHKAWTLRPGFQNFNWSNKTLLFSFKGFKFNFAEIRYFYATKHFCFLRKQEVQASYSFLKKKDGCQICVNKLARRSAVASTKLVASPWAGLTKQLYK
jgi:hypothetical protein